MIRTSWWRSALWHDPRAPEPPTSTAPADDVHGTHAVYLYGDQDELLDRLESYVADGAAVGQRTILFAEHERMKALRLRLAGWQLEHAVETHEATWSLQRFTVGGKVDERLFRELVTHVLSQHEPGTFRLYGEMVGVLWHRGEVDEALRLEEFWNGWLAEHTDIPLLCAYPSAEVNAYGDAASVCRAHSHVFPAVAA